MFISYYNRDIEEGTGAQYQRIVSLISIARRHNLKYIHIPIIVGHNYNNDPEWNEKWEKMFNIKKLANNDEVDYTKLEKIETNDYKNQNDILKSLYFNRIK